MDVREPFVALLASPAVLFAVTSLFAVFTAAFVVLKKRRGLRKPLVRSQPLRRRGVPYLLMFLCTAGIAAGVALLLRPPMTIQEEVQEYGCQTDALMLLDLSGSMWPTKDLLALAAMEHVLEENPQSCVGLLIFGSAAVVTSIPTTSHGELMAAARSQAALVARNNFPDGTNIRLVLQDARELLEAHDALHAPVILFSDLEDGKQKEFLELLPVLKDAGVQVLSVSINGPDRTEDVMRDIFGGDSVFSVRSPKDAATLSFSLPAGERQEATRNFQLPSRGLDARVLLSVALTSAALLASIIIFHPVRSSRR